MKNFTLQEFAEQHSEFECMNPPAGMVTMNRLGSPNRWLIKWLDANSKEWGVEVQIVGIRFDADAERILHKTT